MQECTLFLNESQAILNSISQKTQDDDDDSSENQILSIQLLLQYRLSCEDALALILKIDQNLLAFLGIQPHHSSQMNKDRITYALGSEDLKQILTILALLADALAKILVRYKKDQASFKHPSKTSKHQNFYTKTLTKLNAKHHQLLNSLDKLHLETQELVKLQASGPLYDHINALRGPVSHFHQALMHGLGQAEQLYQTINRTPTLNHQLSALLTKAKETLELMPHFYNQNPNYPIKQFDTTKTTEQLELRAAAKRLRPFFG